MADTTDVILKLLLDPASRDATLKGLRDIGKAVGDLDKGGGKGDSTAVASSKKREKAVKDTTAVVVESAKKQVKANEEVAKSTEKSIEQQKKDEAEFIASREILFAQIDKRNAVFAENARKLAEQGNLPTAQSEAAKKAAKKAAQTERERIALEKIAENSRNFAKYGTFTKPSDKSTGLKEETRAAAEANREIAKMAGIARVSDAEIRKLPDGVYKMGQNAIAAEKNFRAVRAEVMRLSRSAEALQRIGQPLAIGGLAVVAGMFAMGNKEANRQKETGQITAETKRWLDAQQRIELSTQRLGRIAERTILPYLEKASALAEKASKYLDAHPEIAKGILAAGATALTVGTIMTVAAKGIRIYADLKYVAANALFNTATDKFVAGVAAYAGVQGVGKYGVPGGLIGPAQAPAGKGIAGTVGTAIAAVLSAPAFLATLAAGLGTIAGTLGYNAITAGTGRASAGEIVGQGAALSIAALNMSLRDLGIGAKKTDAEIWAAAKALVGLGDGASEALDALGLSADKLAKGTDILRNLDQANLEAEKQYQNERAKILADNAKAVSDANAKLAASLKSIKDNLATTLAGLASSAGAANVQAAREYAEQTRKITEDGNKQIIDIETKTKDDLRKLAEDHDSVIKDLTIARDALGIDLENEKYEKQRNEIKKAGNDAVTEARRNMAQQLADAQRSYALAAQQRAQAYAQQVAEAKAQAAQQAAQAVAQRNEELKALAIAKKEQLSQLSQSYNSERAARINAANQQLMDLFGFLDDEKNLKNAFYAAQLAAFAAAQNGGSAGGTSDTLEGGAASGGYVKQGIYQLHNGEFVLSAGATRAAESLVGGRLNQQNFMGGRNSGTGGIIIQQTLRFSGEIGVTDKKQIQKMARESAMSGILEAIEARP